MSDITVHPKQDQLLPPDPHLVLPAAVRKQIAAADAAHKQVFGNAVDPNKPLPVGAVKVEPEPAKVSPQPNPEPAKVSPQPDPQSAPVEPEPAPTSLAQPEPPPTEITPEKWDHYTKSMQGRYKQQDATIATLQDQLMQMGDEVQRLTTALTTRPVYGKPDEPPVELAKLITDKDVDTFGNELIDVARRAALEATAPELTRLERENQELQKRLQKKAQQDVYNALDRDVANWREINRSARFKMWLRLPDIYSRTVRGKLLSEAFQAADAARVVEFFRGFIRDEVAAGQIEAQPADASQPADKPAPTRTPAMQLDTLAAPGRAASATDAHPSHEGKPVYTHAEIKRFYNDVRRGAYAGRDALKAQIEADMFAAQREGRVRG